MLADNYTVVPDAKITYIGWLTKAATLKRVSSIVVEFTDPEMANAMGWVVSIVVSTRIPCI